MKINNLLFLILFLIISCGPQERISREAFEEANRSMEVKRITEVEIIQEAMVWGDSITLEAQNQLVSSLSQAISDKGIPGAIDFCKVNAMPILKKIDSLHSIQIRRVSSKPRNPLDSPDSEEFPLLDAYEYNAENKLKSDPIVQKTKNGEVFLYTKPIMIPNGMCLNCHGKVGEEINSQTLERLNQLYPADLAKGYAIGDLRGMWSVRIPKKEVVKRL